MSLLINHFYRFGKFTIDSDQRVLLREGKPVSLTPKVFDTLLILVENNGRIVEKDELMSRLWPDTFVEEANLTFNIKQLRKSLGDDAREPRYIETIARRGYRFIADVEEVLSERAAISDQATQRLESSDAQSPNDARDFNQVKEAQQPEHSAKSGNESDAVISAKNLDEKYHPRGASTSAGKRYLALATALVLVLAGVGLVVWKFLNGPKKTPDESSRSDGKNPIFSPLKLEKLTGTGQSRQVAISPDGKYIAYTRNFEQKSSIWLKQLATNTNVEIVPASGVIFGLAFANSGDSLYFVRRDHATALYRVSLLGGVATKIVDKLEGNFSVSSDDSQIAFIRKLMRSDGQQEYSLMIVGSGGAGERTLLTQVHPDKLDVPVWSPDSQSVLCSSGSSESGAQDVSIVEVRVADGVKRALSSDRFFHITKMAWLPFKSGLILSARKNLGDNNELWRISYPGMEVAQITEGLSEYVDLSIASSADKAVASQATRISDIWVGSSHEPRNLRKVTQAMELCWTPARRLVYSSMASGNGDLWIMQPDGTEQRQLTIDPGVDGAPAVSADNRYIVFVSNRTGALQVWRMNIDGGNQVQLTDGPVKNYPAMSTDGKWVFYNTTGDWHLWKVSIDGGEPIQLTGYVAAQPSVSIDGRMIACMGGNQGRRELLIVPFEGGQPLRRFDSPGWNSRPRWTEDGKALIYATERDGARAILKQPLDGGPPEEIVSFAADEIFDFGFSFDGQSLAVTRGGWQHDVVLLTDLSRY